MTTGMEVFAFDFHAADNEGCTEGAEPSRISRSESGE